MSLNLETITSPANPLVKRLRSLERKKGRADTGLFLAEGQRLIEQGLSTGWRADTVMVAVTALDRPHVTDLAQRALSSGARVVAVPESLISKITHKDNAQTIIAAFEQQHRTLAQLSELKANSDLLIGLYEVRDPGNLGTILRTADCANVGGVVLVGTCCDPYSVEAVRASMGSVFDMPFAVASPDAFLAWRTAHGITLTAASVNGTTRHDAAIYPPNTLILMGNEQSGLPPALEAECDHLTLIPMRGGADSLNLAQATAIMTYEAWRQRDFT